MGVPGLGARPRTPPCVPLRARSALHVVKEVGLDSLVGGDGESCDVVLHCSEGLDRALPAKLRRSLSKETIRGKIVDRDRDHKPAVLIVDHFYCRGRIVLFTLQDVVCQERFVGISAYAEQLAGRGESLGDFGDDSGGAENRELRAERGEQVAAMTLSPMIGMDGDLVDEGSRRPLGADQDADRVGTREDNHAAAAPDLKVADRLLERSRRHGRLVGKVRNPAAIQRVGEKRDVVRAAEAVRRHPVRLRSRGVATAHFGETDQASPCSPGALRPDAIAGREPTSLR